MEKNYDGIQLETRGRFINESRSQALGMEITIIQKDAQCYIGIESEQRTNRNKCTQHEMLQVNAQLLFDVCANVQRIHLMQPFELSLMFEKWLERASKIYKFYVLKSLRKYSGCSEIA